MHIRLIEDVKFNLIKLIKNFFLYFLCEPSISVISINFYQHQNLKDWVSQHSFPTDGIHRIVRLITSLLFQESHLMI